MKKPEQMVEYLLVIKAKGKNGKMDSIPFESKKARAESMLDMNAKCRDLERKGYTFAIAKRVTYWGI